MRITTFFVLIALGFLLATGIVATTAAPSSPPASAAAKTASPQSSSSESSYLLKVKTQMVALDLIATDSHGNAVRDLKQQDLQIFEEHNNEQKIARFELIDKSANAPPSGNSLSRRGAPASFYSNQLAFEGLGIPPTVLLMDGLNTDVPSQASARNQMLRLLKTLPSETPVAVFLLGNSLHLLQGFTNDPALLRSALEKALNPQFVDPNPLDDANSISNVMLSESVDDSLMTDALIQQMQDFEKEQYASTVDIRVATTIESLTSIGQYLSGIPGRKNLVWVSQSFPITLVPDLDYGQYTFAGTRSYGSQLEAAGNTLTDAQVSVYPMDASGLAANQSLTASQSIRLRPRPADGGLSSRLNREDTTRVQSQGTMERLAKDTGGKTCSNMNDLAACVNVALQDSSSYYELGFYPQNVNWDGKFHRIVVKTSRPGVKLTYRRGYFALDLAALAKKENPDRQLHDACARLLPSTSIRLVVIPAATGGPSGPSGGLNYQLLIAPDDVTLAQTANSRSLNMAVATCVFGAKGNSYGFNKQDIAMAVSDDALRSWQSTGIPDTLAVSPNQDTQRVRAVVLDLPTGLLGAVDVPVRPQDLAKASQPAPQPAKVTALAVVEIPDKGSPALAADSLKFSLASHEGSLSWKSDALVYQGELAISQSAPAFFKYAFGARFRCQTDKLIPVDPAGGDPKLQAIFRNTSGKQATVDLKGDRPEYSGDLPVDSTAKEFFDQVWKLTHCQAGN